MPGEARNTQQALIEKTETSLNFIKFKQTGSGCHCGRCTAILKRLRMVCVKKAAYILVCLERVEQVTFSGKSETFTCVNRYNNMN
jgi:hypothetical protein